jgi:hypothetical protein
MRYEISKLTGYALDLAVAAAINPGVGNEALQQFMATGMERVYSPSTVQHHCDVALDLLKDTGDRSVVWSAGERYKSSVGNSVAFGPTPLIATARSIVVLCSDGSGYVELATERTTDAIDLRGRPLDYAVSIAVTGRPPIYVADAYMWMEKVDDAWIPLRSYSSSHAVSGPILDDWEVTSVRCNPNYQPQGSPKRMHGEWASDIGISVYDTGADNQSHDPLIQFDVEYLTYGPTRIVAGLRAIVRTRFGRNVKVPYELFD